MSSSSSSPSSFHVEVASQPSDFSTVLAWTVLEHWNTGVADPVTFFNLFPSNLYVGKLNGSVVSSLMITPHESGLHGWVGIYIVVPEHRGKGFGKLTWDFALADYRSRFGQDAGLGLSGVQEQVPNYEKSGFVSLFNDVRHVSKVATIREAWGKQPPAEKEGGVKVVSLGEVSGDQLAEFDRGVTGVRRHTGLLEAWRTSPTFTSLAAVKEEDGSLVGFVASQPAHDGTRVGPFLAVDSTVAELLLAHLAHKLQDPAANVYIDMPSVNEAGKALALKYGFEGGFACRRMFTASNSPKTDNNKIFGIGSWEISF